MNDRKRIAILMMLKEIESNASIISLIELLAKENYIIDIYSIDDFEKVFDSRYKNINIFSYKKVSYTIKSDVGNFLLRLINTAKKSKYNKKGDKISFIYMLIFLTRHITYMPFFYYIYNELREEKYLCYIGIEKLGIILANILNVKKEHIIYYSLELYYSEPENIRKYIFRATRRLEIISHNRSIATIIQDKERARILLGYNQVKEKNHTIIELPVSLCGGVYSNRTKLLHNKLSIPVDKKIFLQLSYSEDRMSKEIVKSALTCPADWIFVMHGNFSAESKNEIKILNSKNIVVWEERIPFKDLALYIASADIGLVFYKIRSNQNYYNNYYISKSSGQLAHFLQCGIPIISINIPSLERVVTGYKCGIIIDSSDSIVQAGREIFENYECFRENAFKCFNENYRFESNFESVNKFLRRLAE